MLSMRRCLSSGLSLPSGPSKFAMEFLSEDEGVAGVDEEAGFFQYFTLPRVFRADPRGICGLRTD